ncbi:hypothetical protein AAE478_008878 [Parahypoxylon ruwenzoriense]
MQRGFRVVKLYKLKKSKPKLAAKKRPEPRTPSPLVSQKKPTAVTPTTRIIQETPGKRAASSPPTESRPEKRVATSPIVQPGPKPRVAKLPTVQSPFENPHLNNQPLHWSPRMFKPEIDRYNWSWSEWDSPSRDIVDMTYETEDWPKRDPLAALPPHIREHVMAILARKPSPTSTARRTDSLTADTVRYETVNFMSSFSSSSDEPARPKSSDDSSWVYLDVQPWPTNLLEMWIDSERNREWCEAHGIGKHTGSTMSSISTTDPDMSARSGSSEISSLLQMYIDGDKDRQGHDSSMEGQPGPSTPNPDAASICSQSSEFSSWVDLGGLRKWDDRTLEMYMRHEENARTREQRSERLAAIRKYFDSRSIAPYQSHTGPVKPLPPPYASPSIAAVAAPQDFYTRRELPSAIAMEPRQSSEEPARTSSGFGWKSLAAVAVASAAITAGIAYAWFSS